MDLHSALFAVGLLVITVAFPAGGEEELHDRDGRIVQAVDEGDETSSYEYDEDDHLVETRRSDGTVIVHAPQPAPEGE